MRRYPLAVLAAVLMVATPAVLALRAQAADYEPHTDEEWAERDAHTDALAARVEQAKRDGQQAWRRATRWPRT